MSKDIPRRKDLLKSKGLCFGCLSEGLLSKDCKLRKNCNTCNKAHLTSLHGDVKGKSNGPVIQSGSQNQSQQVQEKTKQHTKSMFYKLLKFQTIC